MQRFTIDRVLWWLAVAIGVAVYWVAPYPPMTDLPQHAAQLGLFRDLLLGQSPWSAEFQINPFTPYWVGYGLFLPLSIVFTVTTSLKILLTCSFLGFIWSGTALSAYFGADRRLNWLLLPSYFGFAYAMGFLTFLVALPLGLWFLLLALRHVDRGTPLAAAGLLLAGLVVLAGHGLVFAFVLVCGVGFVLLQAPVRRWPVLALPYIGMAIAAVVWLELSRRFEVGYDSGLSKQVDWNWHKERLWGLLRMRSGSVAQLAWLKYVVLWLALPLLMGARLHLRAHPRWIPLVVLSAILLFAPSATIHTAYLNERFGLLLFPAWAWVFDAPLSAGRPVTRGLRLAAHGLLAAMVLVVMGAQVRSNWQFGREMRDFQVLLEHTQPRRRALSLVLDPWSAHNPDYPFYLHFPSWYQARQQGLVDFNFGWFLPQPVRFRPSRTPLVRPNFEWAPARFDWVEHDGRRYQYFFVRSTKPLGNLFRGAPCAPITLAHSGPWTLFGSPGCPAVISRSHP